MKFRIREERTGEYSVYYVEIRKNFKWKKYEYEPGIKLGYYTLAEALKKIEELRENQSEPRATIIYHYDV